MRIVILSDSHGNVPLAIQACDMAEPFDMLFHLGDGVEDVKLLVHAGITPCLYVAGNCDFDSSVPRELIWEGEEKRVLLTHGHMYGVKSGLSRLIARAKECKVDMVLYGHTHLAAKQVVDGILVVNPGALNKTLKHSFAVAEIVQNNITIQHYDLP